MHARALQQQRLTVEFETVLGAEVKRANAEALTRGVGHLAGHGKLTHRSVQRRALQGPQGGVRHLEALVEPVRGFGC